MTTPLQRDVCDPWPIDLCCTLSDDVTPELIARWQMVASLLLWRFSGRRWGPSCPVTVRPCRKSCMDLLPRSLVSWGAAGPWIPYIGTDGQWRNASVCGCTGDCSCGEICEIYLPGPVYDIVSVQDGVDVLPDTAYRVDNSGDLIRTDGECWPTCQDMSAAPGEENTLTITYRTGLQLDESATAAVSELTCHLLRGCGGSCGCTASGRNVTRLTRQGVQLDMADPTLIYSEGRTGLPLTDLWLASVNPYGLSSPSRVYSVDFPRHRIQRGTP
ncbi:hypothetical protein [Streptomyces sp. G1]|uniref:hypothetical protein n=1 Tax=Streptomyces sp. G1 TaxID=361572 RepID=UPI00202F3D48|nr:hypothetical protein [Streptomyces sp. G1]MCM1964834.1 hypothetical protein [Streptomyces sp. G1]